MLSHRIARAAATAAFLLLISASTFAGIVDPPWDPSEPRTTLAAWTFANPQAPFEPLIFDNVNGVPQMMPITGPATYLPDNPLTPTQPGTGVWCLGDGASLTFFIPNFNTLDPKEIFVSIKYSVPAAGVGVPTVSITGVSGTPSAPAGPVYTVEPVSPGVSMIHYLETLPTCEPFFASVSFPFGLPGAVGYIEQVVIQTRCLPEPGSMALLGVAVLISGRRRRTQEALA